MRPVIVGLIIAALAALPAAPVAAQSVMPAKRIKTVQVFGSEPCPKSTDPQNEIVVCPRGNPDDQFRIPQAVRNEQHIARRDNVGAERTALADHSMSPTSCTPAGFQGQFGCSQGLNILGAAKAAKNVVNGDTPIPDAPPQP